VSAVRFGRAASRYALLPEGELQAIVAGAQPVSWIHAMGIVLRGMKRARRLSFHYRST
jgi:hypothetical protein